MNKIRTKSVDAKNFSIETTLKKGKFIIPPNQREYSWEVIQDDEGEINELWDDLIDFSEESHFLGHIVLDGSLDGGVYEVIDGQQRLTTITLLLIALRDEFIKRNIPDLDEAAHSFIYTKDRKNKSYYILENQMPYPVLQIYQDLPVNRKDGLPTQKFTSKIGEKNIIEAYNFFITNLSNKDDKFLETLYDKVLNCDIIFVASQGVDGASIFETLNATGKDLSSVDLIKNAIFKLHSTKTSAVNHIPDGWKILMNNCGDKIDKFFLTYWAALYGRVSKYQYKLYRAFRKDVVKKGVTMLNFIDSLNNFSLIYKKIINPERGDWGKGDEVIFQYLFFINVFGSIANPVLMIIINSYLKKEISKDYCIKVLGSIANFHFLHNKICSKRSSGWDKKYSSHATSIYNASDKNSKHLEIDNLVKTIKSKYPTDAEIRASFDSKISYEKDARLVRYVLFREELVHSNSSLSLITEDSIEHMYPKSEKIDVREWPIRVKSGYIHSVGNLFLLESPLNSAIGDKSFLFKKGKITKKSVFLSTKDYLNSLKEWDNKKIEDRKDFIIKFLQKL